MFERPTAVLNCAKEIPKSPHCEEYLHLQMDDVQHETLAPHFAPAHAFIDAQLSKGKRVLVHCYAGVSRSTSIVIGYLMYRFGMTFTEAYDHVKSNRREINPNIGFVYQLNAYGEALKNARALVRA
jgi:protein-tyrosine phosphatase